LNQIRISKIGNYEASGFGTTDYDAIKRRLLYICREDFCEREYSRKWWTHRYEDTALVLYSSSM